MTAKHSGCATIGWCLVLACAACGTDVETADAPSEAVSGLEEGAETPAKPDATPEPVLNPDCVPFEPAKDHPELVLQDRQPEAVALICPSKKALEAAIAERDRHEVPTPVKPDGFVDPMPREDGLALYDYALRETGKLAWFVPVLFNGTPPLGDAQRALLEERKALGREYVEIWKSPGGGTPDPYAWTGGDRWKVLAPLLKKYKRRKDFIRAFLLRKGGVLYVEDARAASDIYRFMSLPDLFDEEEIWQRRGDAIQKLRRKNKLTYVYAEGPREGETAKLLIFDRLATTREGVEGRIGWDLNRLRPALALKAFRVHEQSADLLRGHAVLRSAEGLAPNSPSTGLAPEPFDRGAVEGRKGELEGAAFEKDGRLTVAVVIPHSAQEEALAAINDDRAAAAVQRGMLMAAEAMLAEQLPFDEPLTEEGQQDGHLRPKWLDTYMRGGHSYNVNGDRYTIFTRDGAPKVPQVCIDFIYDTAERWSGRWYADKAAGKRGVGEGFIDIEPWIGRREKRQVSMLIKAAETHTDRFDLLHWPESERIKYADAKGYYSRVRELSATTMPADIFAIFGMKTDGRNHWHAFLVYDVDPMYHTPYLLISNNGRVRVQPWHALMRSGPGRSLVARVRWKRDWLDAQRR